MGREKSDDRVVPKGRRKAVPTAAGGAQGGKAVTASQQLEMQLLRTEPAEFPQGTMREPSTGLPVDVRERAPLSEPQDTCNQWPEQK